MMVWIIIVLTDIILFLAGLYAGVRLAGKVITDAYPELKKKK